MVSWEVLVYLPDLMWYAACYPLRWMRLLPWCPVSGPELSGMCFVAEYVPDVFFALWCPRWSAVRLARLGMRG